MESKNKLASGWTGPQGAALCTATGRLYTAAHSQDVGGHREHSIPGNQKAWRTQQLLCDKSSTKATEQKRSPGRQKGDKSEEKALECHQERATAGLVARKHQLSHEGRVVRMPLDQLVEQARLKQETQKCKRSAQGKHESKLQRNRRSIPLPGSSGGCCQTNSDRQCR